MKISKSELKTVYGIDIPAGLYRIKNDGISYTINLVKDDTDGCILVGKNKEVGKVLDSRYTYNNLYKQLEAAAKRCEYITIEIK